MVRKILLLLLFSKAPISENSEEIRTQHPVIGLGLDAIKADPNLLQTIRAMIKLRLLNIYREPSRFILVALVPLLFSAIGLYLNVKTVQDNKMKSLVLNQSELNYIFYCFRIYVL